jgi:hypothetical protein
VNKKQTDASIIQPIIDDLKANAPPELPIDDVTPPPRGPLHPPQPTGDDEKDHL